MPNSLAMPQLDTNNLVPDLGTIENASLRNNLLRTTNQMNQQSLGLNQQKMDMFAQQQRWTTEDRLRELEMRPLQDMKEAVTLLHDVVPMLSFENYPQSYEHLMKVNQISKFLPLPTPEQVAQMGPEGFEQTKTNFYSPAIQAKFMELLAKPYAPTTEEGVLRLKEKGLQLEKKYKDEGLVKGTAFSDDQGNMIQPFFDKQGNVSKSINLGKTKEKGEQKSGDSTKLRGEFIKGSATFIDVRDSYNRVVASANEPSAAGDLALLFNYMKILDPQSTVREGEFATAAATGSWGERLAAASKKLLSGERLTATMRKDFVERARALYSKQLDSHKKHVSEYKRLAERSGFDSEDVIVDYPTREEDPYDVGSIYEDAEGIRKKYLGKNKWGEIK